MRRVVVTGVGVISSLGTGTEKTWEALLKGETGIKLIESFNTDELPVKMAGVVDDFNPEDFGIDKKELKKLARFSQFGIAASKMALEDSGLVINEENAERIGVIVSSGIGGLEVLEEQYNSMLEKGPKRVSAFTIPAMIANMSSGNISIYLGAKGPNKTIVTACAAGTHSVGDAFELIKHGRADVMVAGGTEACISKFCVAGFNNMTALSKNSEDYKKSSRPFTIDRDGFVMGEGAGVLILEEYESAKARGAKIYAEMIGYGETGDAHHMTAPASGERAGAVRAIKMALDEAGIDLTEVDYINAHGTSTPTNDKVETAAIKTVFGEHAYNLAVSSTKGATGHCLGGAGGIEAVILALAIKNGVMPPTINYENADPECDLNYVPNVPVKKDIRVGMSNSLGFGGHNAVIAMRKVD